LKLFSENILYRACGISQEGKEDDAVVAEREEC